jgi:DNA-binding NarL/FixJ family response regulator
MPEIQVVMQTVAEDDQDLFEAIKAGATGYLPKNLDPHELFDMLARAGRGEAAIKPALAFKILREFRQLSGDSTQGEDAKSRLTSREIQVLELVVRGATNKSIAETLCISVNTVKTHLRSILGKLQLNNRTEMAAYALAEGLVGFRPSSPQDTSPPPDPGY